MAKHDTFDSGVTAGDQWSHSLQGHSRNSQFSIKVNREVRYVSVCVLEELHWPSPSESSETKTLKPESSLGKDRDAVFWMMPVPD